MILQLSEFQSVNMIYSADIQRKSGSFGLINYKTAFKIVDNILELYDYKIDTIKRVITFSSSNIISSEREFQDPLYINEYYFIEKIF
jgi:hypothetical protein